MSGAGLDVTVLCVARHINDSGVFPRSRICNAHPYNPPWIQILDVLCFISFEVYQYLNLLPYVHKKEKPRFVVGVMNKVYLDQNLFLGLLAVESVKHVALPLQFSFYFNLCS
jgi:hypothetical protein